MKSEKKNFLQKSMGTGISNRDPESYDCAGKCF